MKIAFIVIVLSISGCGLKSRGDLLTGSISINDNIDNRTATEVLDTTKDVYNGVDRIRTIGRIFDIYTK